MYVDRSDLRRISAWFRDIPGGTRCAAYVTRTQHRLVPRGTFHNRNYHRELNRQRHTIPTSPVNHRISLSNNNISGIATNNPLINPQNTDLQIIAKYTPIINNINFIFNKYHFVNEIIKLAYTFS